MNPTRWWSAKPITQPFAATAIIWLFEARRRRTDCNLTEPRLLHIARLTGSRRRVADVGAGDGRLSRHLVAMGHTVVATELSRAQAVRLETALLGTTVPVFEGFGLRPLTGMPFDVVVAAGLGGATLARILTDRLAAPSWSFLLQPMQDLGALARGLRAVNRGVSRAVLVRSQGRLYPILEVPLGLGWNGGAPGLGDGLGLWLERDPLWGEWLARSADARRRALQRTSDARRRHQLQDELSQIIDRLHEVRTTGPSRL